MDADSYRSYSLETWGQMAPGWEARREWLMRITDRANEWLLEKAGPQPGQTYLEVAAGTGDLGFMAAERLGPEGRLISTDFAPEMVEVARRQGERRGVSNVEYQVLDAERMNLEDDSVDGVLCRWGYMLMADPAIALRETRRVLRDGGPLAFAVWGTPETNPWAAVPAMTLIRLGHFDPPAPGEPGIFAMGEPGRIRELVSGAGFGEPELEDIRVEYDWPDFAEVWDTLNSMTGPLARAIAATSSEERQAIREAFEEDFAGFRQADGSYRAPGAAWGVSARA